ncbi:MAG: helix-turn-helix domain-containing protein [Pseudomonadota bacterium]
MADDPQTVRALARGLSIVQTLNKFNGLTIDQIGRETGLPRPTAFRLLHTLMDLGYVVYMADERQYRVTPQVSTLSSGYEMRGWMTDIAAPILDEHANKTPWPLTLCTRRDETISVAYVTDQSSQLIVERVSSGVSIPLYDSAVGTVFLAYQKTAKSGSGKDLTVGAEDTAEDDVAHYSEELEARIKDCHTQGHSVYVDAKSRAIAVPITTKDADVKAVLAIRCVSSAGWSADEDAYYAADLKALAAQIENELQTALELSLPI